MSIVEAMDSAIRRYIETGRQEKDNQFRRSLALGPTERRWLGWAGARVMVLSAHESAGVPLCPTLWEYKFTSLNVSGPVLISPEINFCDDDNVLELLYPWHKQESCVDEIRREIENPVFMYYI